MTSTELQIDAMVDLRDPLEQLADAYADRLRLFTSGAPGEQMSASEHEVSQLEAKCRAASTRAMSSLRDDPACYLG